MQERKYVLASGSPRRIEMMRAHGIEPAVFPAQIEENLPLAKKMVKALVSRGGKYSMKLSACNVYVEDTEDASVRRSTAYKLKEDGKIAEICSVSEFCQKYAVEDEC